MENEKQSAKRLPYGHSGGEGDDRRSGGGDTPECLASGVEDADNLTHSRKSTGAYLSDPILLTKQPGRMKRAPQAATIDASEGAGQGTVFGNFS